MIDTRSEWNFADPAGSQARFEQLAEAAVGADRTCWLTQVARAHGLQGDFDAGHAVLDALPEGDSESELDSQSGDSSESRVRIALERGRLLRSAGQIEPARPHFERAADLAADAGLTELQLDALHMVALVAAPDEQVAITQAALAIARAATEPGARNWDASLLNNLGMCHADAGDFAAALPIFEEAWAAR